ncbi:hypothetical protein ACU4GD_18280 [Cupriavidus basilensis]
MKNLARPRRARFAVDDGILRYRQQGYPAKPIRIVVPCLARRL